MSTVSLQVAPRVAPDNPRGARVAAELFVALWRFLATVFRRPPAPEPVRSVEDEAREVRELALQYQQVDPRFAAELLAAADRHERLYG